MIYRKQSDKNLSDHLNYEFVKWLIACVNGDSKYGFKIRLLLALVLFTAPIVIKIMGFEKIIDWSFLELRFYFYLNFYIFLEIIEVKIEWIVLGDFIIEWIDRVIVKRLSTFVLKVFCDCKDLIYLLFKSNS